jgi:hypothetical protein
MKHLSLLSSYLSLVMLTQLPQSSIAQNLDDEMSGQSPTPQVLPIRDPASQQQVMGSLIETGVLLIPESTNDRVMAFDPNSGDLIDADFIPADPTNLSTPIQAILSADLNSILVSDQLDDVVQQYDLNGNYQGVFAPAGGLDNNILDNIRGISLDTSGNLLVTVGGGANDDAVAQFDGAGNYLGNFIANGAGGLDSPFDVIPTAAGEYLVGGITSDNLMRFDALGTYIADLSPINTFPEQLYQLPNGNFLVANFSGTEEGVVEYTSAGVLIDIYDPAAVGGNRGVFELGNGNILTTNGSGVHEIDRSGNLVETKISGVSARFISFVQAGEPEPPLPVPSVTTWGLLLLGVLLILLASRIRQRV